jgi:hypothetical protein
MCSSTYIFNTRESNFTLTEKRSFLNIFISFEIPCFNLREKTRFGFKILTFFHFKLYYIISTSLFGKRIPLRNS